MFQKSRRVYNSKLQPYATFLNSIKRTYIKGIKFDKDPLVVEQKNYLTKIVNVYIVYDVDGSPRNPKNNFNFKNCSKKY